MSAVTKIAKVLGSVTSRALLPEQSNILHLGTLAVRAKRVLGKMSHHMAEGQGVSSPVFGATQRAVAFKLRRFPHLDQRQEDQGQVNQDGLRMLKACPSLPLG